MKLLLSIFFMVLACLDALSCTCISTQEPLKAKVDTAYSRADLIISGIVVKEETKLTRENSYSSADPVEYTFEINKHYKGEKGSKKVIVITAREGESCGFDFQIGKEYLVYAYRSTFYAKQTGRPSSFITSICERTSELDKVDKKEKKLLTIKASQKP